MHHPKKNVLHLIILVPTLFGAFWAFGDGRAFQKAVSSGRPNAERTLRAVEIRADSRARSERFAPGQVLVRFNSDLGEALRESIVQTYGLRKLGQVPGLDIYKFQIPQGIAVQEMAGALKQNPDVDYAEPNYVAHLAVVPNDPYFRYQYALSNAGQQVGSSGPKGTADADIKATTAWDETQGSAGVIIAVVDTGVDMAHPDLKNKMVSSGRDFVNNDNDATDDFGHGTMVAGIAAAETNNGVGIAGVSWNSKILPVKVIDAQGNGYYDAIVNGIRWAADNGAGVINLSLGGPDTADSLRLAVKYAHDKGVVVCAAAGNEDSVVLYPAAYDDFVLAVAATDYNDARTSWSNYGPQVDVAAPGDRIACPVPTWFWAANGGSSSDDPYAFASGTSMSTPIVSGLAALIKGIKPTLSTDNIMDVIRFSADDVNAGQYKGKDNYIGYGRINLTKALVPIKIAAR